MNPRCAGTTLLLLLALLVGYALAQVPPEAITDDTAEGQSDLALPVFEHGEPLFTRLWLDPEGEFAPWVAFGKSGEESEVYDVMYLDLNDNGDLTEEGERFEARIQREMPYFAPGTITVPGSEVQHTGVNIRLYANHRMPSRPPNAYVYLSWRGETRMRGYAPLGRSLEAAPVLALHATRPLSIDLRGPTQLLIGRETTLSFYGGHRATEGEPFCTILQNLSADGNTFCVTLIGKNAEDEEVRLEFPLTRFC